MGIVRVSILDYKHYTIYVCVCVLRNIIYILEENCSDGCATCNAPNECTECNDGFTLTSENTCVGMLGLPIVYWRFTRIIKLVFKPL